MYRQGFQQYVDVVGVHAPGYAPPEIGPDDEEAKQRWFTFRRVEDLRKIMLNYGDEARQMAIMEVGYTTDRVNPAYQWFGVSEARTSRLSEARLRIRYRKLAPLGRIDGANLPARSRPGGPPTKNTGGPFSNPMAAGRGKHISPSPICAKSAAISSFPNAHRIAPWRWVWSTAPICPALEVLVRLKIFNTLAVLGN